LPVAPRIGRLRRSTAEIGGKALKSLAGSVSGSAARGQPSNAKPLPPRSIASAACARPMTGSKAPRIGCVRSWRSNCRR
jgi:hypothetical protein